MIPLKQLFQEHSLIRLKRAHTQARWLDNSIYIKQEKFTQRHKTNCEQCLPLSAGWWGDGVLGAKGGLEDCRIYKICKKSDEVINDFELSGDFQFIPSSFSYSLFPHIKLLQQASIYTILSSVFSEVTLAYYRSHSRPLPLDRQKLLNAGNCLLSSTPESPYL